MSAERPVYVKVVKEVTDWIEVSAITLDDAIKKAKEMNGVVRVVDVLYDKEGE